MDAIDILKKKGFLLPRLITNKELSPFFFLLSAIIFSAIILLSSCAEKRVVVRMDQPPAVIVRSKLVFTSSVLKAALENYSITNQSEFNYSKLSMNYKEQYGTSTEIGKTFFKEKIEYSVSSNLIQTVYKFIDEKSLGCDKIPGKGTEGNDSFRLRENEKDAMLMIFRMALIKDPKNLQLYFEIGAKIESMLRAGIINQDEDISRFLKENVEYGIVMNHDDSQAVGILLPAFLSNKDLSAEEMEAIYFDQLKMTPSTSQRSTIYKDILDIYIGQKNFSKYINCVKTIEATDPDCFYRMDLQIIPSVFNSLYEYFQQYNLIISLWETKYRDIYFSKMNKTSDNDLASLFVAFDFYCQALYKINKANRIASELNKIKEYGVQFKDFELRVIRHYMGSNR